MDKILAAQPLKVPVMLVAGLWDQEDIYGATAVYKAIKPKDTANDKVFLVIGPWHHGQQIDNASSLGAVQFGSDTGLYFRQKILAAIPGAIPEGWRAEGGRRHRDRVSRQEQMSGGDCPDGRPGCESGCTVKPTPLYLEQGQKLGFTAPKDTGAAFDEYISDPAKPVPYRARPSQPMGYTGG